MVGDARDGAEQSFCDGGATDGSRKGQDSLLNLRGEPQHSQDLGYPTTGNALAARDLHLAGNFAGIQESLPFDCLFQKFGHPRRFWLLGRLRVALERRKGVYDPVDMRSARHTVDRAILGHSLVFQGDLDGLLAVGGRRGAVLAGLCVMHNPETDVGLGQPRAGSHTGTFGEP
ncbi:MAG: hypothetical protein C4529_07765 [Deltaproteobacteria bacterium]|nr:MAG: hypothetical protein C4529_07765 [Deltaproteobacteria bacterium]